MKWRPAEQMEAIAARLAAVEQAFKDLETRINVHAAQLRDAARGPLLIISAMVAAMTVAGGILFYFVAPPFTKV